MSFFVYNLDMGHVFSLQTDGLGGAEMQQDLETLKQAPKQWGNWLLFVVITYMRFLQIFGGSHV